MRPNAYLNKLRLAEWRDLFSERMPGAQWEYHAYDERAERDQIAEIRTGGELREFDDQELVTVDLAVSWRK